MVVMSIYLLQESIVPVRKEPSHKAEQIDELLFGYRFKIIETFKNWLQISTIDYPYEGWIPAEVRYEEENGTKRTFVISEVAKIRNGNAELLVPMGSLVDERSLIEGKLLPSNENISVIKLAMQLLSAPYRWGGKTIFGIDCSGLIQLVFSIRKRWLPRDAHQQAKEGEAVFFIQEAQPGDVAFFANKEGEITHTGLIISSNQILHASGQTRIDRWDQEGIIHAEKNIYTHRLKVIKRFL
jgi:hypothetical protein